jgi:hypothetical protein
MGTPNSAARVDAARAVVLPGTDVAVRLPGVLCLLRLPGPEDGAGPGHLARLVEILTENTAANPAAPGRPLARRLARWLGTLDPGPDFGIVAATESGVALFLHGAVDAVLGGQRYSARDSGAWLDRLLAYPAGPVVLLPSEQDAPDGARRVVFDLRGGVVPAGAVLLVPRSGTLPSVLATSPTEVAGRHSTADWNDAARDEVPAGCSPAPRPGDLAAAAPERLAEPIAVPAAVPPAGTLLRDRAVAGVPGEPGRVPTADTPPATALAPGSERPVPPPAPPIDSPRPAGSGRHARRVSPILGVGPDEPRRPPLADGPVRPSPPPRPGDDGPTHLVPPPTPAEPGDEPTVRAPSENGAVGFRCARDHLNEPRSRCCVVCGIGMDEPARVVEIGVRPSLGILVFDDGSTATLDGDYLLGRMPEADPRVVAGLLRPLIVDDPEAQLSRAHLVIRLDGGDVCAIDESTNGTLVSHLAEPGWSPLPPHRPLRLLPGTQVRLGGRSFVFESLSGVTPPGGYRVARGWCR